MIPSLYRKKEKQMFTFENPQTPIIENDTVVNHNGKTFRIENNVLEYFYRVQDEVNGEWKLVRMTGNSASFDWAAGATLVENTIKNWGA